MPHTEDEAHDELGRRELAARTLPGPGLLGREVPHGRPAPLYIGDNLHIPKGLFASQGQSTPALIPPGGPQLGEILDIVSRPFEAVAEAFGPGVTKAPPFNLLRPLIQLPGIGLRTVFGGEPGAILDIDPTPIQESAETSRIMSDLLRGRGDLTVWEAAKALSEDFRERPGSEQGALALIGDPFNVPAVQILKWMSLYKLAKIPLLAQRVRRLATGSLRGPDTAPMLIPGGAAERPTVAQTVGILARADAKRAAEEARIIEKRLGLVVTGGEQPPISKQLAIANLSASSRTELGRGVYFSTDREIAQGFAEGLAPFAGDVSPRPRTGTELVSRFSIPKDTKIFSLDDVVDHSLLRELQQEPNFARVWKENWSGTNPSRNNLWGAAEEARVGVKLQALLESKGFKGARHPQMPGQFDYAIWDRSVIERGTGGIQLFRGAPAAEIGARGLPADIPPRPPGQPLVVAGRQEMAAPPVAQAAPPPSTQRPSPQLQGLYRGIEQNEGPAAREFIEQVHKRGIQTIETHVGAAPEGGTIITARLEGRLSPKNEALFRGSRDLGIEVRPEVTSQKGFADTYISLSLFEGEEEITLSSKALRSQVNSLIEGMESQGPRISQAFDEIRAVAPPPVQVAPPTDIPPRPPVSWERPTPSRPVAIPLRPPGEPLGYGLSPPRRPDIGVLDDLELPSWEPKEFGIMRIWEGARNVAGLEMQRFFNQGTKSLRRAGFNPNRLTEKEMGPLFEALHNREAVDTLPQNLRSLYDELNPVRRIEERDHMDFLAAVITAEQVSGAKILMSFDAKNLASRFMAHFDYFPRGWDIPDIVPKKLVGRGQLGVTPAFAKPRIDAGWSEMLEWAKKRGGGPKSWNPYAMMAERVMSGVEYRESVKIVNRARELGLALPLSEAPKTGWRVPRVGIVFEGRPLPPNAKGQITYTQPIATTNPLADFLEVAYGRKPDLPGLAAIQQFTNVLKSAKLMLSPFQHADFFIRTVGTAFAPSALVRGGPAKLPSFMFDMLTTTLSPRMRERLINNVMDDAAFFRDGSFVIPGRMLVEEGWNVKGDLSFIAREFSIFIDQTSTTLALTYPGRAVQSATNALKEANNWFQGGLFDGTYRSAQRWSLKHFILPYIHRSHPNWTPRQVAAEASDQVNIMFSTIGIWQDIFKNPSYRFLIHNLAFSANETQALLRGAGLALSRPGAPKAGLFREWYVGIYLGLAAIANVVNFWATGHFLPKESYIPINLNDPYAPFTVGYNNRLLAPQIPYLKGRGDVPIYADLVGQMDTAFRWALDPIGALAVRTNVLPRFFFNQFKGKTFFNESLHGDSFWDTVRKRAVQGAIDIGAPIGATSVLGALREKHKTIYDLVPSSESRLGFTGQLLQAAINLRAETTEDYLDGLALAAGNSGYLTPDGQKVTKWDQLLPRQKNQITALPEVEAELLRREEEGIDRGVESAIARKSIREIDDIRFSQEMALDERLRLGLLFEADGLTPKQYREEFSRIQLVSVSKKAQSNEDFRQFVEELELPDDPYKRAIVEYYLTWDYARRDDGSVDFRKQERLQAALEQGGEVPWEDEGRPPWTPEQIQVVADNTRLLNHSPTGTKLIHDRKLLEPYFDIIDDIIDDYGVRDAFNVYSLYRTSAERDRFLRVNRPLASALRDTRRAQRNFEKDNRDLAQLLVDWDYEDYTFNRDVRRAVRERILGQR